MMRRASFACLALFWVIMNGLLWRAEFGSKQTAGSAVPASLVWERILTAPDESSLSVSLQGQRLGYIRLRPTSGEKPGAVASENEPEGIVRNLSEYTLDIESSIAAQAMGKSVRVNAELAFEQSLDWKRFQARVQVRPMVIEIKGDAAEGAVWLQAQEGETEWVRRFTMEDLRQPQKLLEQLGGEMASPLLPLAVGAWQGAMQSVTKTNTPASLSLGLDWKARSEWLRIGTSRVRIFRLESKLFGGRDIVVLVSRVGEILRAEIPGGLLLVNETLFVI